MLQAPTLPPGTSFTCPVGQEPYQVSWDGVDVEDDAVFQTVVLPNGYKADLSLGTEGDAEVKKFELKDGYLRFAVYSKGQAEDRIRSSLPSIPRDRRKT